MSYDSQASTDGNQYVGLSLFQILYTEEEFCHAVIYCSRLPQQMEMLSVSGITKQSSGFWLFNAREWYAPTSCFLASSASVRIASF